jgi:iron complex outermembrane receptor protein
MNNKTISDLKSASCRLMNAGSACAIVITGIILGLSVPVLAQTTGTTASQVKDTIEEIVVTARKREEQLQDVPQSISAFTADDMDARSATSLGDIANLTPNFSFLTTFGGGTSIRIRGVGQNDPSVFFDPGVAIYVDGAYIPRMRGVDFDLMDFARIEVLRGPQGTLFGRNATGGALNIITTRPGNEFSGSAEVTIGRYDRLDGKLRVDVPLAPGVLSARLTGATGNRDGYGKILDFSTGAMIGEMGNNESLGGRAEINWTPRSDVDVLLSLDISRMNEANPVSSMLTAAVPPAIAAVNLFVDPDFGPQMVTGNPYTNYGAGSNYSDSNTWGISANVAWEHEGWSLRSITSYREMNSAYGIDPDLSPLEIFNQTFTEESQAFSQELQLSGQSFQDRLDWIAGLYYFEEDSGMTADTLLLQPLFTFLGVDSSLRLDVSSDATSWAVFGQGTYQLTDRLSITAGLRYSEDEKEVGRVRHSVNRPMVVTLPFESLKDSWGAISSRAGIEYRWTNDVMTYFSASRGFKSGGINGASFFGQHVPFDPEYIWTYELGLRSDWLDKRLRFNATGFYSDYTDLQFRVALASPTGAPIAIVTNAAKAEIYGFEIELSAVPAPGLELTASTGYTHARYTELDPGTPVTLNDKFAITPEWSLMLAGQYTIPVENWGELTGRVDYSYKSETELAAINSPLLVQDGYSYVNARLTFRHNSGNWEVAAFVTNLTDEIIAVAGADFVPSFGFATLQYAAPRQWGVSLKYNF